MRIHHFNPEHEICLASGRSNYTPPHAATRLRSGLGWMPALWAEKGDIVLVDDSDYAKKAAQRWRGVLPEVHYLTFSELKSMLRHISMDTLQLTVSPWGWDLPLRQQLMRSGVPASHLPTLKEMDTIRTLAHRRTWWSVCPAQWVSGSAIPTWPRWSKRCSIEVHLCSSRPGAAAAAACAM